MQKQIEAMRDILTQKIIVNTQNVVTRLENHFKQNPVKPAYCHPFKKWEGKL